MQRDSSRRRFPLADRVIEVIDDTLTGEVLLDEALKKMKSSEKMSVSSWIDLMSGKDLIRCYKRNTILILTIGRGNMESYENWLSVEASPRTPCKRTCR